MTASEALFYFLVYSVMGWLLENTYSLATTGRFWKEGLLLGPYKPMYGAAPLLLIWVTARIPQHQLLLTSIFLCFLIPTVVEYVSGCGLKAWFGRTWWDYSGMRGQLHGHICIRFSVYWGILSLLTLRYIHPGIEHIFDRVEAVWTTAAPLLLLLCLADFVYTCLVRRKAWRKSLIA
ncbi:putative ABC transporter permease [Paenibacillus apis]|nr:putative ABC transporter permease [Paenibacillus apis]